jgi:intracellular sulfur oxidation DsrE/DsrF family protein
MTRRRDFIARMGAAAAALAIEPDELRAHATGDSTAPWDTSWIDRVTSARHRVVFNGTVIDGGAVMNYVAAFLDHFHEVHDTSDADTRPVVVFRRLGTPMALNDRMWDRYAIGAGEKVNDSVTGTPALRNVFWRAGTASGDASDKIETLHKRGMISLVCNVSISNMGRQFARAANTNVEEVQAELRANLVPGAILVPSGIYALIRAQNAGCAFMLGT